MPVVALAACLFGGGALIRLDPNNAAVGWLAEALLPAQQAITGSDTAFGRFFAALGEAQSVWEEKEAFRERAEATDAKEAEIRELRLQNAELRSLLQLAQERWRDEPMAAQIVGWDPNPLVRAIKIDRGRKDGVAVGMVVVTPRGLVGRVQRVSHSTAQVLLLVDRSFSASGVFQVMRARGIVEGPNGEAPSATTDYLIMRYIDQKVDLRLPDTVVTSPMGGGFPDGIPIGDALTVLRKDTSKFQEVIIRPAVDFTRLEWVMVLTKFTPAGFE